jgi:excisionase family DNA binding protein
MSKQDIHVPIGVDFANLPHDFSSRQIYYTKAEAADYTRHSLRTLDYAVERGELRAFKPSKKWLFLKSDLDAWIRRKSVGTDLDKLVDEVVAEVAGDAREN